MDTQIAELPLPSIMSDQEWTQLGFLKLEDGVYERIDRHAMQHPQTGQRVERKLQFKLYNTTAPTEEGVELPIGVNIWFYVDDRLQSNAYCTDKADFRKTFQI